MKTPWGFFDKAIQGNPLLCGINAVLLTSPSHYFLIEYVVGRGSNMKVELSTLWDLLHFVNLKGII